MWRSFHYNPRRKIVLYTCTWINTWFLHNWRYTKIRKTFRMNLLELFEQKLPNKIWNWFNCLNNIYWPQQQYMLSLTNIRFISDRRIKATAKAIYGNDLCAKPGDESTNLKIALIVTGSCSQGLSALRLCYHRTNCCVWWVITTVLFYKRGHLQHWDHL